MNPDIANFMFKTTYLDSWGSGVKRMVDACREANVPVPRYELRPGGLVIIFERTKRESAEPHFTKDFIKETGVQLTERQEEIILLISEDSTITSQKISQKISQKNGVTSRTILKDLKYLREVGLLTRVGGRKDGVWKVLKP